VALLDLPVLHDFKELRGDLRSERCRSPFIRVRVAV